MNIHIRKFFAVLLVSFAIGPASYAVDKPDMLPDAPSDFTSVEFAQTYTFETEDAERPYGFNFCDFDERFWKITEPYDAQGGGYTLEAMLKAALEIEKIKSDIYFDSEGECLVTAGSKRDIGSVATLVQRLLTQEEYANKAIKHAKKRGYFE